MSSSPKVLFGFHAVGVRLKTAPQSVIEIYYEPSRRDARMRQFLQRATEFGARLIESDGLRLSKMCGSHGHQGVVARVNAIELVKSLDELLEQLEAAGVENPLLLVLDSVTDPHNLGACLRVADGAGAHAVIAPKDHAAGINATVAKVASGAADTMPYFMVTNLARTLGELKERSIWCIGTADDAPKTIYDVDLKGPVALVLGAEGEGMRQLTRKTCDELVSIPMHGAVESLNVSVASGVCLYVALRQRRALVFLREILMKISRLGTTILIASCAAFILAGCTQEQQNKFSRDIQNWTGTNGVLEFYAGDKLVRRFLKIDKISTALGTDDGKPRPYRFGYGVLDENLNFVADPGEKKVYFEISDYGSNYIFFENPR